MGLKLMISGPFSIENVVGVGCRVMVLLSSLGTLVGTLKECRSLWSGLDPRHVATLG